MVKKFLIAILFLGIIPFDPAMFTLFKNPELGQQIVRVLNVAVCAITGVLFVRNLLTDFFYERVATKYLKYFAGLMLLNALASMISSEDALLGTRLMSIMCLWAYYTYGLYTFKDAYSLIRTINITLLILIVISMALYYVDYEHATYIENATTRYFKGVAANRNSYAEITLFYVASNFYLWGQNKKRSWFYILTTALAVYTTYLTHGATSNVTMLLMILMAAYYTIFKKTIEFRTFLIAYVAIFISLIIMQSTENPLLAGIFQIFEKDSSMTGRTDIWKTSLRLIAEYPIFGRGYDTQVLWQNGIGENDPHNSILYMLLTQGLCGTIIFFVLFYNTLTKAKALLRYNPLFSYMYIFIITWMIRGLTESVFSYTHFVFWIAIIIIEMLFLENNKERSIGEDNEQKIHQYPR
jgi:O-antigen ligase